MTKHDRAIALRDLALSVVKARGDWQEVQGGPKSLTFRTDGFEIGYRSPFQRLPAPSGDVVREAMAYGEPMKDSLPHGLDIWQRPGGKVLNVEWPDKGAGALVVSYRPGPWEQDLERLAASLVASGQP